MTHHIVWTYQNQQIEAEATCDDPECLNRFVCAEAPCEVYYDVRREDDGTVTHKPWEDEHPAINRHRMENSRDCAFAEFLNAIRIQSPS